MKPARHQAKGDPPITLATGLPAYSFAPGRTLPRMAVQALSRVLCCFTSSSVMPRLGAPPFRPAHDMAMQRCHGLPACSEAHLKHPTAAAPDRSALERLRRSQSMGLHPIWNGSFFRGRPAAPEAGTPTAEGAARDPAELSVTVDLSSKGFCGHAGTLSGSGVSGRASDHVAPRPAPRTLAGSGLGLGRSGNAKPSFDASPATM